LLAVTVQVGSCLKMHGRNDENSNHLYDGVYDRRDGLR
jgi:hypothetical protein